MLKLFRTLSLLKHNLKRRYVTCLPKDPCDPGTQITILDNGIRIATECRPTPLSCMTLCVEAGSRFETVANNGITHFIEHMAYKGFCSMSQCDLEESLLYMGANMTALTTREIQTFTATFMSEHAPNVVGKLSSIITELATNDNTIEAEKYNICLEMVDEDNDPRAVTFDYLHQTAFQGTPLANRVIGPSWNVRKFDCNFALNFLQAHYQPYKICIVTCGNVCHQEIVNCVQAKMGHLIGQAMYESDEGPTRFTGSQIMYRDDSMPYAHVAIAFEAPGYNSKDFYPLLLASNFIGKWHKSQGGAMANVTPLAQAAACDDLCESFESFYITYRDIGLWGIYYVAKRTDVEDMLERIQNQWMHLCITFPHIRLERAVNLTKLELARNVTGVVNACKDLSTELLYTCTRRSLQHKFDKISSIEMATVRRCAEDILYDKCPAVVAVGPTENLPEYNRIRAGQHWLRY